MTSTTTSCPRCGAGSAPRTSRCTRCGFVFFEEPSRRSLPRPSPLLILLAVLVLAAGAGLVVLLTRDPPPGPLKPVAPARAEQRLEKQLSAGGGDRGSVRCAGPIRAGRSTRCQFIYADGDTQLMLVTLTSRGELSIDVPYPAQRRPAG